MSYYPVFLNIKGKKCVVFGGGEVALHKVTSLLDNGARVKIVSPVICSDLSRLAETGAVQEVKREYRDGDLRGVFLAIAATDNWKTNLEITVEARRRGCLVNTVDDADHSDFILPSCLRRGDITIAVSTSGKSPALARKLRHKLEKEIGNEYASLIGLVAAVREEMKKQGIKINRNTWQEALDIEWLLTLLKSGDTLGAKAAIMGKLLAIQDYSNVS
ncbi:MAG: hypothetical protein A2Z29_01665 [Chloroflexi bacterium RBG_16_56_11]|nr:MAG: hypothetical protein A2Z29_01665 [Chloroflexi bacterium RBG_16_56_11]